MAAVSERNIRFPKLTIRIPADFTNSIFLGLKSPSKPEGELKKWWGAIRIFNTDNYPFFQ